MLIAIAWALSERRGQIQWRAIVFGLALQFVLALLLTQVPPVRDAFGALNGLVIALNDATRAGTSFVFGYVGGGGMPFTATTPGATFIFAFQALPLILLISALSALGFHVGLIQPVVRGFAWVLRRTIGVDGPAGLATAVTIFIGNVEGPMVVRPYLAAESRAGLFVMMTAGMGMVSGTMMVVYATMLADVIPNALGQILTASILAAPGAAVVAFLMVPETESAHTDTAEVAVVRHDGDNWISVIARGALDALPLIVNIIVMLITLIALVTLINTAIAHLPDVAGAPLTLQRMFGWVMAPLAWLVGVPWSEAITAGGLLGTKMVLNELVAYADMAALGPDALAPRTRLVLTYALCGFANFASMGITIGGMSAMVPQRRREIIDLTPKALISGTITTCLSGAMIGLLTPG